MDRREREKLLDTAIESMSALVANVDEFGTISKSLISKAYDYLGDVARLEIYREIHGERLSNKSDSH